jgi:hypothetical protein
MIVADIWEDRDAYYGFSIEEVRNLLGYEQKVVVGNIPFDDVYTSSNGFVGRQRGRNPNRLGLTWRLRPNLVSEVFLPLNFYAVDDLRLLPRELAGYAHVDRFTKLLLQRGYDRPRVVDLNVLFNALIGVAEIQARIAAKAGWTRGFSFKAKLVNVWRTIPFLDVADVVAGFEKHGIPMCLDGKVLAPAGSDPEDFKDIPNQFDADGGEYARVLLQALGMFAPIARAFGLPAWFDFDPEGEAPTYYDELQRAGNRSSEVQKRRDERRR